jgi:hypothetical protein
VLGGGITVERSDVRNGFEYQVTFGGLPSEDVPTLEVIDVSLTRTVGEAIETKLRKEVLSPADLVGFTVEITEGPAKNKFRLITGGDVDASDSSIFILDINRPWEGGLTTQVPDATSKFTIENTNPNLLVDENEETDILYLSDADSVVSYHNNINNTDVVLEAAALTVNAEQLTGLGMSDEGVRYTGLEELFVTLGRGDNLVTVEDTHGGRTTIDGNFGEDTFDVRAVSGHTFLNGGPDADTFVVGDEGLVDTIGALLTLTGDVPQVLVKTLAKGSPEDLSANVAGVSEIQQFVVQATGGTFQLYFGGSDNHTGDLDYNASAAEVQSALEGLDGIDAGDVEVKRFGPTYRVYFKGALADRDVALLGANDLGLTAEGPADRLLIDDSADQDDGVGVLTPTSLTGLDMGRFGIKVNPGNAPETYNEIQTLRIDASGGTFDLSIQGTAFSVSGLAFNISAEQLDAELEEMFLAYFNAVREAENPLLDELAAEQTSGGLVEVTRNDDVYVIRFVGLLSNFNVPQVLVDGEDLTGDVDDPNDGTAGKASSATRIDGITAEARNEIQKLTVSATGGTFKLAFGSSSNKTVALEADDEALRANLLLALEALDGIAAGDVKVDEAEENGSRVFTIEFIRELSSTNFALLTVEEPALTGGGAVVSGVQDGFDTGMNDVQVLTVDATGGTYRLELFIPELEQTIVTLPIAYDASAEDVWRALQHALARSLNDLADNADMSRVREAFKTDFTVVRTGDTYLIGFQGKTRETDAGPGVALMKVLDDDLQGSASVVTRMDGINYYGFERVDIRLGDGRDVFNVQGTSAGSYKLDLDTTHAATNVSLADGDDQVFVSSNADLDHHTIFATGGLADVFEFLTGDLNAVSGNLNFDLGAGRHRIMVSDEAATVGDESVRISDDIVTPTGIGVFDDLGGAEIQIQGLAFGDITYGADASANLFDGVVYWTGYGDDTVDIDGTHYRSGERTPTLLNTGLGDDHVTVDLDETEGDGGDGFFVLNTMGGAASPAPEDDIAPASDDDTVRAAESTLPLLIFGGFGDDDIIAGQADDIVFGDFGRLEYYESVSPTAARVAFLGFGGRGEIVSSDILDAREVYSLDLNIGGNDIIEGQAGDDLLIGGANTLNSPRGTDYIDGDADDDLIFGDAVELVRRDVNVNIIGGEEDSIIDPRFQALLGQVIYSRRDVAASVQGITTLPLGDETGDPLVTGDAQDFRNQSDPIAAWTEYLIVELYHSQSILDGDVEGLETSFGDDYIAGGTEHDVIFGQLGDDTIQGDGSIASAVGAETVTENRITNAQADLEPVYAKRVQDGVLVLAPDVVVPNLVLDYQASFETADDGDDYIEGNGGADVIFGNLGQDDIVGDNSSLFTLDTRDERLPSGSDIIFGGAGTNAGRNDLGDATQNADNLITVDATGHARDADAIAGDNANIYRLVGVNGAPGTGFLEFNYDKTSAFEDRGELRIIPRAVELLDYTLGGPDFKPAEAALDIGASDEIHGEAGDDFIYGMVGSDVLFGDGQDDDLIGGYGNDWFSGGTGQDGVIGDDGRIFSSRNGTAEPLNGVMTATAEEDIDTPGNIQLATIHVTGDLKKAVDLTPFSQQPDWVAHEDEWAGQSTHKSDDIIYGGLGSDFLHGGSGDDAVSGGEALQPFFDAPINPGDALQYGRIKAGEFAAYDEFDPLRKLLLNPAGVFDANGVEAPLWKPGDPASPTEFFLNFAEDEGVFRPGGTAGGIGNSTVTMPDVHDDGDDKIFGDLGNDWLVGGTGRDNLWGGWGDDLMNADDDHSTHGDLNDEPETHPTYEDRAYGGAGRDILIGNTGGDRLIDWAGEWNSYLVPFAPFGEGTVTRMLQPQLPEFLYALSKSDGADPSRAVDEGASADPARNGEPFGEIGLVKQQDFAWQSQTGAPNDPQPGNIPGGSRDVLRSANFNGAQPSGFFADSGVWEASNGVLKVTATGIGGDAASVFHVGDALPAYFELQAQVMAIKPTGGWEANSFMIFDYQGESDFKFAGLDVSINKLVMGHRDASGWHVDKQGVVTGGLKADKYYNLLLAVNGTTATLLVDNKQVFTHTYQPRVIDGYAFGLNSGLVGMGSRNSRGAFDNIQVQILPPQVTLDTKEDFNDGLAQLFAGEPSGAWSVDGGRYGATPSVETAMSLVDLGANLKVSSYLELSGKVNATGFAGYVFDRYGETSFKFVAIDANADRLVIGHYTKRGGWAVDASFATPIEAGQDYTLNVVLKGSTVSAKLNPQPNGSAQAIVGFAFNAATVDGSFGLLATGGPASFDDVRVKTDDPAFAQTADASMTASTASDADAATLTQAELDAIASVVISQWGGALADVRFAVADLPGTELGHTEGNTVVVDADAAGVGWYVDVSPAESSEFAVRLDRNVLAAAPDSEAYGRFDLVTVVAHEVGHLLGLDHADAGSYAVMAEDLDPGVRYVVATEEPVAPPPERSRTSAIPAFDLDALLAPAKGVGGAIDWQASAGGDWSAQLSPYAPVKPAQKPASSLAPFAAPQVFDSLGKALLWKGK